MSKSKRPWERLILHLPNGQNVSIGSNSHVSPSVPCGRCSRAIRYYVGDKASWPWYCSPECERGEPITKRCPACGGAIRHQVTVSPAPHELITCKSCALRVARVMRMMHGWDEQFGDFVLNKLWAELRSGVLRLNYFVVENHQLIYKIRETAPAKPRKVNRAADPTVDEELETKIRNGMIQPDGTFDQSFGPELAGRHYREVNRDLRFPPPAKPVSAGTDVKLATISG